MYNLVVAISVDWSKLGPQIIALAMVIAAVLLMQEHRLFPNTRELRQHRRRYMGFALFFLSVFVFLYASSQDLPIVFASWGIFLLAFATFLSVEQSQRMMRETRQDVAVEMVRNWAKESLRTLSGWQPDALQKILETIEADGFTADVTARGVSNTLESNVRAAVACCITLRVSVEQSSGLPAEVGAKVDQLKQHLMIVINAASQRQS